LYSSALSTSSLLEVKKKSSVRICNVLPEIQTWYLPQASQKTLCLSQPVRCKTQINLSVKMLKENDRELQKMMTDGKKKTATENKRNKRTKK
jgi:hypothetical protein